MLAGSLVLLEVAELGCERQPPDGVHGKDPQEGEESVPQVGRLHQVVVEAAGEVEALAEPLLAAEVAGRQKQEYGEGRQLEEAAVYMGIRTRAGVAGKKQTQMERMKKQKNEKPEVGLKKRENFDEELKKESLALNNQELPVQQR